MPAWRTRIRRASTTPLVAIVAALIVAIFVADTLTEFEIAVSVFYVVPILLSARALRRGQVMPLAFACVGLTAISSLLTAHGSAGPGLVNLAISVVAIIVTAYLAMRMLDAETAFGEARAQLIRVSRISNLGELASSIAHEVNQPLGAIVNSVGACRRWLDADPANLEQARASLERIGEDAERASGIVKRIRRLSQNRRMQSAAVDVNAMLTECLGFIRRDLDKASVQLVVELADGLPHVFGDRIQLQQVFGNILINALEALAETPRDRRVIEVVSRQVPGSQLMIRIADSGPGISSAALPQVFNSMWTSKEGGTGLGLTIAQTIVESHGGHIDAASGGGQVGTSIVVSLPPGRDR